MTRDLHHLSGRVVIVGSGLAGLAAALTLAPEPVVLVTRAGLGAESSSAWAQGGIAAGIGEGDSTALHVADTLAAGDGLCDPGAAAAILGDAKTAIATLERFGVRFDRGPNGAFAFGLEAAHSRRRILHVEGDGSGAAIMRALVERVRKTPSIEVLEGLEARRLLVSNNRLRGLACAGPAGTLILPTNRVILATGGLGGLYGATTNPSGNYGQGVMLAARAGAILSDMEFVQFHPTALDSPRRPLALVSEAVRGEGAILLNEKGERFLSATPGAELAPRDVVARAIGAEIARGGRVFLDAREALGERFASRFPLIAALCQEADIYPAHDLIPVRPAVHYHMGGVATDLKGRSSVEGLWVAGEAACTGLHGANRLASNSLLEATVMGMRAASDIAGTSAGPIATASVPDMPPVAELSAVREIATRDLSVVRDAAGLERAIGALLPLAQSGGPSADPALVALAVATFGRLREESRGAHARSDFRQTDPEPVRRQMTLDQVIETSRHFATRPLARTA